MNEKQELTSWHEAYREVAECLYAFQRENNISTARLLKDKLLASNFDKMHAWFRQGIERQYADGVDPIQVFAGISQGNHEVRVEKINQLLQIFGSKYAALNNPEIFVGCPTPQIIQIINFRDSVYQSQIWEAFISVMSSGKKGLKPIHFEQMVNWYGIGIPAFTIFLFWINSDEFVPCDENTITFLASSGVIERVPENYTAYLKLCNIFREGEVIRDITRYAYQLFTKSENRFEESGLLMESENILNQFKLKIERERKLQSLLGNFKLIALRPTRKIDEMKNLKVGELSQFYQNYDLTDEQKITYKETIDEELYHFNNIDISISAIVGKNGSGKSTISELLLLAINKVALDKKIKTRYKLKPKSVYVDVFYKTDSLYKLSLGEGKAQLFAYTFDPLGKVYIINETNIFDKTGLDHFFYSIVVNYSLYGLNKRILGDWIDPLFHKNDGYQTPVVLNPKREEGKIDVNNEQSLADSRLLGFILDWNRVEEKDGKFQMPELVEGKRPVGLRITLDQQKLNRIRKKYHLSKSKKDITFRVSLLFKIIQRTRLGRLKYKTIVEEYLYSKLVSIAETYPDRYGDFMEVNTESSEFVFIDFETFVRKLYFEDFSHVTFKLRQAINYLIHGHYAFDAKGVCEVSITEAAEMNNEIVKNEFQREFPKEEIKRELTTIELIPPAIFHTEIDFGEGGKAIELSSGEKQMIFAMNTVAYHLFNLNSIQKTYKTYKYRYVNVLFDEVELYFHPDMQRRFISNLRQYLSKTDLNGLLGINFLFITHSPFILSDIPSSNILRLIDGVSQEQSNQTFAANIYDLLNDDFFLSDGVIGEFAKQRINNILAKSEISEEDLKVLELIGDPFLKSVVMDKANSKINNHDLIRRQIRKLEEQLNSGRDATDKGI